MKQSELNRAVASVTGESVSTIKRLGFLLADPAEHVDPESVEYGPYVIDWDELEAQRFAESIGERRHEPAAA